MEKCKKTYTVKIYECDQNETLRFSLLFNLFQDMADTHSHDMGLGYDYCLQHGIGWVGASYAVKINRLPKWGETFTLATWPSAKTAISGIREFEAVSETGESLFCASSQWVLIDLKTKRPVKVDGNVPAYELIPERTVETTFPAVALPERTDFSLSFPVRYDEIDINRHVNNANYPLWATEAVSKNFREQHTVSEIEIAFKKPAVLRDEIMVQTEINGLETRHLIKSATDDSVFARVKITWAQCG